MSSTNIKWVPVLYVTHQIEDGLTAGVPERLPGLYDSADAALSAATAALAVRPDCHSATAIRTKQPQGHAQKAQAAINPVAKKRAVSTSASNGAEPIQ